MAELSEKTKRVRTMMGEDYIGIARMLEASISGTSDHRLAFQGKHTKKERAAVTKAEEHILRAANLLRAVGNRMTGAS